MRFYLDKNQYIETGEPLDISLELSNSESNVKAWYVDAPQFEPVKGGGFVGEVAQGGNVNFRNIFFNPHGHGTHTECLGHITKEIYSVNDVLKEYFFDALLVSILPKTKSSDAIITKQQVEEMVGSQKAEALIIRTLPNAEEKKKRNYSFANPPYLEKAVIDVVNTMGVKHLLIDLPSVDKEEDGGVLAFHHAFWDVPKNTRMDRTITELIFVDNFIEDGRYILEIQMAAFKNDASPSRPVLYKIKKED